MAKQIKTGSKQVVANYSPDQPRDERGRWASAETETWLHEWSFGKPGDKGGGAFVAPSAPAGVMRDLTPYRPATPTTLYRAHYVGPGHAKRARTLESWTTSREMAEAMAENHPHTKVISAVVHPSNILVDTGRLPKAFLATGKTLDNEVIVAWGKHADVMRKLRGEANPYAQAGRQ